MKIRSLLILAILGAFASLPVFAQGGKEAQPSPSASATVQKYTCPMHPEVVADKPGKCPKCGMHLTPVTPKK